MKNLQFEKIRQIRFIRNVYLVIEKPMQLVPDAAYLKMLYRFRMGKRLNLKKPERLSEKLQWLKLYDRKPYYSKLVDKYAAKEEIARIIGKEYIVPNYGVWDHFDDIDFDSLPDQFVLKCTHDSGGVVVCRDKSNLDKDAAKKKIEKSLKRNFFWAGREWPYKDVKPQIIAEKYLEQAESEKGLTDYKFFCFNGIPKFLYISRGFENHATTEVSFYDMNGEEMYFHRSDFKPYHNAIIPSNFEEMKTLTEKIAKQINCPCVRVDLYSVDARIYFSEITFYTCSGMIPFEPMTADEELGQLLQLPIE